MQKANLIIRGFLFKKGRVQGCNCDGWWEYDINFLYVMPGYLRLIDRLSQKYELSVYFSSYDTTPSKMLECLSQMITIKEMIISPEENSHQFTTMYNALEKCSRDLTFIIRSDLIIKEKMTSAICNFDYSLDAIYAFAHENSEGGIIDDNVIDVFHAVSGKKIDDLLKAPVDSHGRLLHQATEMHHLHHNLDVEYILPHDESGLPLVDYIDTYKSDFWEIYRQAPYSYLYEYNDFTPNPRDSRPLDWDDIQRVFKVAKIFDKFG